MLRRQNAFTLIELVVVVAIIALLVAILLPALSKAREVAAAAVCAHNTHQWALAFVLYDSDSGALPSYCHAQNVGAGGFFNDFHYVLGPYLGYDADNYFEVSLSPPYLTRINDDIPDIYFCPSSPGHTFGYGVNALNVLAYLPFVPFHPTHNHITFREPLSIHDIPRPSQTIIMTDSFIPMPLLGRFGGSIVPPYGVSPAPPDRDYDGDGVLDTNGHIYDYYWSDHNVTYYGHPPVDMHYNGIGARHGDRMANCVFLDGHAESVFINDLMDEDRRLWGEDIWE